MSVSLVLKGVFSGFSDKLRRAALKGVSQKLFEPEPPIRKLREKTGILLLFKGCMLIIKFLNLCLYLELRHNSGVILKYKFKNSVYSSFPFLM